MEEKTICPTSLIIHGEYFPCELGAPHDGLAHSSQLAQAIWCGNEGHA